MNRRMFFGTLGTALVGSHLAPAFADAVNAGQASPYLPIGLSLRDPEAVVPMWAVAALFDLPIDIASRVPRFRNMTYRDLFVIEDIQRRKACD
jgi:hypothetical protein